MRTRRHPVLTLLAPVAGVLVGGVAVWQFVSAASLIALFLDNLMPLTALATLGALLWLFVLVDAGNRGEDAGAHRARALACTVNKTTNDAASSIISSTDSADHAALYRLRVALLDANESSAAASLASLGDGHAQLAKALNSVFASTELSYHRYSSLADGIIQQAKLRLEAWLATPDRATARDQILDELDAAVAALRVAATEVTELAETPRAGGLADAARELAELAARAPRLAGH